MDAGPEQRLLVDENPLLTDSPEVWDRLLESVQPASLLVVIESRMSGALRQRVPAEDILQEALLCAWRDRRSCEWRGMKSFRSWLLTIIDHRIRDAADHESAAKRGGGEAPLSDLRRPGDSDSGAAGAPEPIASTTPSRVAMYKEQAAAMHAALADLPEDSREIVRLRLFEQLTLEDVAGRLGLSIPAVRYRFWKGAEEYERRLRAMLASRTRLTAEDAEERGG